MVDKLVALEERQAQLYRALADSALVRYFRPFSKNYVAHGVSSRLAERFCCTFTGEQKELHKKFETMRDKLAAHSDLANRDILLFEIKPPGAVHTQWTAKVEYQHLDESELEQMREMIDRLQREIEPERQHLSRQIGPLLLEQGS
jgi:hypothetical protein